MLSLTNSGSSPTSPLDLELLSAVRLGCFDGQGQEMEAGRGGLQLPDRDMEQILSSTAPPASRGVGL